MRLFFAMVWLVVLLGCAPNDRPRMPVGAQRELVGMTKGQLIQCAGAPFRVLITDGYEFLTYPGGGGGTAVQAYCQPTFVLKDDVVESVNYQDRAGFPTAASEQCALMLENCVRR